MRGLFFILFVALSRAKGDTCSIAQTAIITGLRADLTECEEKLTTVTTSMEQAGLQSVINLEELVIQASQTVRVMADIIIVHVSNYSDYYFNKIKSFDFPNSHFLTRLVFPYADAPVVLLSLKEFTNVVPLMGFTCDLGKYTLSVETNVGICESGKHYTWKGLRIGDTDTWTKSKLEFDDKDSLRLTLAPPDMGTASSICLFTQAEGPCNTVFFKAGY